MKKVQSSITDSLQHQVSSNLLASEGTGLERLNFHNHSILQKAFTLSASTGEVTDVIKFCKVPNSTSMLQRRFHRGVQGSYRPKKSLLHTA